MTEGTENGRGRPREHTNEDVLRALQAVDDGSGVRTGEVADRVGCSTRTALRRLTKLEEQGQVEGTDITQRMKLWSTVDE
jgi:predicted ArsR family transcriptional regulator